MKKEVEEKIEWLDSQVNEFLNNLNYFIVNSVY